MTDNVENVDVVEEVAVSEEIVEQDVEVQEERKAPEVKHRAMALEMSPIDEETRTVSIAVSSEEPVARSFGDEVLLHAEENIDLEFLRSGRAPLLLDHDPEKQIGVIQDVELDTATRRLRAKVRFGKSALASEAFDDVVDGIRANISVGYGIDEMKKRGKDTYVATKWRPVEASLVSIPADVTVGVGRSSEVSNELEFKPIEEIKMTTENTVDIASIEANAKKDAQRNASQIAELGQRHGLTEEAHKAIAEGATIDQFRGVVLDTIGSKQALENQDIGMDKKEIKRFSLVKAIRALANPNDQRAQRDAEFEFECSRNASEMYGRTASSSVE